MNERLNDLLERIELMEEMIETKEIPKESEKVINTELKELYSKVMNIAISMV
jgi:hypothetical protein